MRSVHHCISLSTTTCMSVVTRKSSAGRRWISSAASSGSRFQAVPCLDLRQHRDIDWKGIYSAQQPVVLRGLALSWPALADANRLWSDLNALQSRLQQAQQEVIVPIEVGAHYMDPNLQKHHISLYSYLDFLRSYQEGKTADVKTLPQVYLAQHSLREIPLLHGDVEATPELCRSTGKGSLYDCKLWWSGPRGSVSPCHFDPFHNLLVHIVGEKKVVVVDPKFSEQLYPAHGTLQKNTSLVDFEAPDLKRFSNFQQVEGFETTLQAGDALYIPFKWWHFCTTKTIGCSVNYWWL